MTFQKQVNIEMGFGVPGDIHTDGPTRTESLVMNSEGSQPNYVGNAFTKDNATSVAKVGGEIASGRVFAGILVNAKAYPLFGTNGDTLAPTLALPDHQRGDFLTMGDVVVKVATSCKIGDLVAYDTTTGELSTVAVGSSAGSGKVLIPNAVVYRFPVTTEGGLTVIRLTN